MAVLIPVFNGYDVVRRCVDSVLRHSTPSTPIYLLDDASTDLGLLAWLDEIESSEERVRVVRSDVNLGFVGNVNRGLNLTAGDVIVLNSDTVVTAGWIDKLATCASSQPDIGLVCPLSNNATILSVPAMNSDNALPHGLDIDRFAAIVEACSVRSYPRLPVAVGFCMLIKRSVIEDIGALHRAYDRGYGEECDLSLRAREAGFDIRCCDDTFVYHDGERSFGALVGMDSIKRRNEAVLLARWPFYNRMIAHFCRVNPLRETHERISEALTTSSDSRPHLLQVLHSYDTLGGTELHSRSVIAGVAHDWRTTVLYPDDGVPPGQDLRSREADDGVRVLVYPKSRVTAGPRLFGEAAALTDPLLEASFGQLVAGGGYSVVHFQHLLGWGSLELPRVAREAGAHVVVTLHDYYLCCPVYDLMTPAGWRCGKNAACTDDPGCLACLSSYRNDADTDLDLADYLAARRGAVLDLLSSAHVIVSPSQYVKDKFRAAYGSDIAGRIEVIPHGVQRFRHVRTPRYGPQLRLGIFANLNRRKGADILLEVLDCLAESGGVTVSQFGGVEERYIGALDQRAVDRHGVYQLSELPQLAANIDLALVPSVYEETFCLTIAELQALGLPVIAFPVGAVTERIRDGETGFLVLEETGRALAGRILALAADRAPLDNVRERLRQVEIKSIEANQQDYARLYVRLLTGAGSVRESPEAIGLSAAGRADCLIADVLKLAEPYWGAGSLGYGEVADRRWLAHWQGASAGPKCVAGADAPPLSVDLIVIERRRDPDHADLNRTLRSLRACWRAGVSIIVFSRHPEPPAARLLGVDVGWHQVPHGTQMARQINLRLAQEESGSWLGWVEAGDTLPAEAVDLLRGYIAVHPHWRFIYTDEDVRAEDGRRYQLAFKPQLNLDLLRSTPYVGDLCLIARDAFGRIGGLGHDMQHLGYGLCLKTLDVLGEAAIGHVPRILYHRSDSHTDDIGASSSQRQAGLVSAIAQHLERQQLEAKVHAATFPDVCWVEYPEPTEASMSLVVTTHGDYKAVRELLEELLLHLGRVEILVIDFLQRRGASAGLDNALRRLGARRVGVDQSGHLAPALNRAIKLARGDYVLVCNDGVHPRAGSDLKQLFGLVARADVGLAAPCVLDSRGRIRRGLPIAGCWPLGALGEMLRGQSLSKRGNLARNVALQNCVTVSDHAFVLKRSVFREMGGFRYQDYPQAWYLLDYSIRLSEHGLRTVWTPHSVVIEDRRGSYERYRSDHLDMTELGLEVAHLYERWLACLTDDPAYNQNLSLRKPGEPDCVTAPTWDRVVEHRPRHLGFPDGPWASAHYRVIEPLQALHDAGLARCTILPEPKVAPVPNVVELARMAPDTLLLHNALHDQHLHALELYRRYGGGRLIFSLDDMITELPAWNPFSRTNYPDLEERLKRQLALCDRLLLSTQPLADVYGKLAPEVCVVPNRLSAARWPMRRAEDSALDDQPPRKPRIGWAGAAQHEGDLVWLEPVVAALADEADWVFFGMCPKSLRPYAATVLDMLPYDAYPAGLASLHLDVAVAPLAKNDFNRCKSNLKLLEYGALGIPVVCTDIEPYRGAPVQRLENQPDLWIDALRARIHDPDGGRLEGEQLASWVRAGWMLEDHLDTWADALK